MKWLMIGAILGGIGVTMGAFGAHGLDTHFEAKYGNTKPKTVAGMEVPASWKYLEDFKTGVRYQMYNVIGLLAVGLVSRSRRSTALELAGRLFVAGIVLFSGALYVLSIAGPHWLGVRWGLVAPFGGLAMIGGWLALAVATCPCQSAAKSRDG